MSPQIAQRPGDIAHCVSAHLQAGDLDGITTLFHPDCQIFFPPDQPPRNGHAGVRTVFAGFLDRKPKILSTPVSEVINGDIALLQADWQVITPDGHVMATGRSTEVATRLAHGGWGYLIDCPYGPPPLS